MSAAQPWRIARIRGHAGSAIQVWKKAWGVHGQCHLPHWHCAAPRTASTRVLLPAWRKPWLDLGIRLCKEVRAVLP